MTQYTTTVALPVNQANNWIDLGAGPLTAILRPPAAGAWILIADSQPAPTAVGEPLTGSRHYEGTSHVWATAYAGIATSVLVVGESAEGAVAIASLPSLPPGSNIIGAVATAGSAGADASANAPGLPSVGAAFGATGAYANYVLVKTVAANAGRLAVDIENLSGAQIAVVRDDGTAAANAAPVNASVFALAGGAAAGQQGGAWTSTTFKGRLQIYAPAASAFVAVMLD